MKPKPWLLWLVAAGVYAFLYVPLAVVVIFSFNDSALNAGWVGFTTRWYRELFVDADMLAAAGNSLLIAALSLAGQWRIESGGTAIAATIGETRSA